MYYFPLDSLLLSRAQIETVETCSPRSNSCRSLAISGPAISQRRRAFSFSVKPIAPPWPLTAAFNCSWAWSIAIAEKALFYFFTVKLPELNSLNTSGFFCDNPAISQMCTGNQRASCVRSITKNQGAKFVRLSMYSWKFEVQTDLTTFKQLIQSPTPKPS